MATATIRIDDPERRDSGFAPSYWSIDVDLTLNLERSVEDAPRLDNYYSEIGREERLGSWGPLRPKIREAAEGAIARAAKYREQAARAQQARAEALITDYAQQEFAAVQRTPAAFRWDNNEPLIESDRAALVERGIPQEQIDFAIRQGVDVVWRRVALRAYLAAVATST